MHRQKDPTDRNAMVDRAIQTLKKDLAGMVARRGGGWGEHVDEAAEAYNARPHQAVTVAPEDVETKPAATFRVYQDNADKFQHNKRLTEGRQRRLQEVGAFRAPTNAQRSFQPQYGPARDLASFGSMVVRGTDGSETLWPGSPGGRSPWRCDSSETSIDPLRLPRRLDCSRDCYRASCTYPAPILHLPLLAASFPGGAAVPTSARRGPSAQSSSSSSDSSSGVMR